MTIKIEDLNEDYTINISGSALDEREGNLPEEKKIIPYKFFVFGPWNIRSQSPDGAYRTFLGKQKT